MPARRWNWPSWSPKRYRRKSRRASNDWLGSNFPSRDPFWVTRVIAARICTGCEWSPGSSDGLMNTLFPQADAETGARFERDPTIKLFNEFEWSQTELGPLATWPASVMAAVRNMMVATTPMAMLIGPRGILLYNTGYALFAGPRHPQIFGQPAADAWPEVADFNRENIARGMRGEGKSMVGQELQLNRHGTLETVWLDLHYSPIFDERGSPVATVCVVSDVTVRVMAEQA
ncbi:MAG: PAS domain S-box protein, partial [Hyphomicrobiales bacterium]